VFFGSLFSGIGGLDLGLERAGMRVRWQCEIDPYCRAVLRKHWPDIPCYEDIRVVGADAERVDLVCGGFPCQPVSLAGRGKAQADERWLWPEFERVVGELRPRYVLVENVPGLAARGLGDVVGSLTALGYDAEWDVVSAASVGAPHLRERIFLVAYPEHERRHGESHFLRPSDPDREAPERREGSGEPAGCDPPARTTEDKAWALDDPNGGRHGAPKGQIRPGRDGTIDTSGWAVEPDVGRVAHGVPARTHRLRALGNAVVPQVAEYVGRLILEREERYAASQRAA
jgi:DNA (cytosine-5)-methyltransferase 1